MDKNAIKKFAVWARRELIGRVSQRAMIFGITAKDAGDPNEESVNGHLLSQTEKRQRQALIRKIGKKSYEQVMEEVAYTWFNRFAALRFMEVNGYLPSHIRVFTNDTGEFKPQILTEAIHLELDGLDKDKVYELESANKSEELFKYLLIVQCNALNSILPGMFQKIDDYTELLLPDYLLREGSVIEKMVTTIPEADWTDQVQIIGWLYQYYNIELKNKVFADLKKNIKISKENIPAATQLFTTDWIVHYMVENSLGRLWLEGHPNDALKAEWKYYLDEAEQEPEVQAHLAEIRKEYAALKPEEIRVIDPCMGSGHILCVLFDVLVRIYEEYGYTAREAVAKIVENNLWGLDIDERATQLAYFAVMMKARQYDRRFFSQGIQPHVYAPDGYPDGELYGSLITVNELEPEPVKENCTLFDGDFAIAQNTWNFRRALAQKYDVVVTNPPYMGNGNLDDKISNYIKSHYIDGRNDLFSVFIMRCMDMCKQNAYQSMITQHQWMFLSSYAEIRDKMRDKILINMAHLGAHAFEDIDGEVVQTTSFILQNTKSNKYSSVFVRLVDEKSELSKAAHLHDYDKRYYSCVYTFTDLPGTPYVYWIGEKLKSLFKCPAADDVIALREGIHTGQNDVFLRLWSEIEISKLVRSAHSEADVDKLGVWVPYNKGGSYRKWYGNNDLVIGFDKAHRDAMACLSGHVRPSQSLYFKSGGTWSALASGKFGLRYYPEGFLFDSKGQVAVGDKSLEIITLFNLKAYQILADMLMPTLDYKCGDVKKLPYCHVENPQFLIIGKECIRLAKEEYDSFETSWDFQCHPLIPLLWRGAPAGGGVVSESEIVPCQSSLPLEDHPVTACDAATPPWEGNYRIAKCYAAWEEQCSKRFAQLKANEEELNRIFIDIYGLQDELTPEVEDKDVTVRKADLQRDIRSFLSYAVGCMFGRYSLDVPGLAYAGGEWDASKYKTFQPDKDAIIPICDDEYFEDDIVGRFVKFVEVVYGRDTLEENLRFIADALGGKGSSREVIRNYFINNFYADHLKVYQKRPIYWLFDSGKKNGFKCLIYMHRYQPDTIARIRTDYVHEQQSRYRTAVADLEQRINGASTSERVKLSKRLTKLQEQAEETRVYEEKIHHLADQMIKIDLDDGVKVNYAKFQDVLAKIK